jgi:hypothetical protein
MSTWSNNVVERSLLDNKVDHSNQCTRVRECSSSISTIFILIILVSEHRFETGLGLAVKLLYHAKWWSR